MTAAGSAVRPERSPVRVAVTGATAPVASLLVERLAASGEVKRVIAVDEDGAAPGRKHRRVDWRVADVRDPGLSAVFTGADVVVHLATDRDADGDPSVRRSVNVHGTETVLAAATASGVGRVVLLTSAMVYGADAANPVPLDEDAPVRAEADLTLIGDWVEMERAASRAARAYPSLTIVRVRPASLLGAHADAGLPRMFDAPRLLMLKGARPHWQFCHTDDLVSALHLAAIGGLDGAVTVGCDGWLEQAEVEKISGLRSLALPSAVAFATAERLNRVGVVPAPASELRYLAHPWVVGSQRLRAAGWKPQWSNADALAAHVESLGAVERTPSARVGRKDATRAAAGAAVAVVGTVAIARARAARRRRRG